MLVPGDCLDGFGGAYWRRPEAHLDPVVLVGMSFIAQLDPAVVARNVARLRDELADGRGHAKYGHLRGEAALDLGYRLIVCGSTTAPLDVARSTGEVTDGPTGSRAHDTAEP